MNLRGSFPTWIALLAFVPATVAAPTGPEAPIPEFGIAGLLVLGVIVYAAYVLVSVAIGAVVLAVSGFAGSGSYVRAIERRIYERPVRTGAVGVGAIGGGLLGTALLAFAVVPLLGFGLPEPVVFVLAIPVVAGSLLLYVAAAIGTIVLGSYLLRRSRDGEPNRWLALAVGALVVNAPLLNVVLAFVVLFLGTGAMVGHWWSNRRTDRSGRNPPRPAEG